MYYKRFPYDRAAYRGIVVLIWLFETCDQAFIGHSVYYYSITEYGNPIAFLAARPIWSVILQILLGAIVGGIVKLAFAWRVWTFSDHNPFITAFIIALAIAQLALASFFTSERCVMIFKFKRPDRASRIAFFHIRAFWIN
jgi:hypothetical protein